MSLNSVVEYSLPAMIGLTLQNICYGIYCVIFVSFVKIRLKRTSNGSKILLYLIATNFIACTAALGVEVVARQTNSSGEMTITVNSLYTCIDFISQAILVYRCWILWRQPRVIVLPILLTLTFLAISVVNLARLPDAMANPTQAKIDLFNAFVMTFFCLSLFENALATGLIISKILTVYRDIQGSESRVGYASRLRPIISILIESGMITFVTQLVQILMFKFANDVYPIIGGPVIMIYGISTAVVLVRVEMGLAYDVDNKASRTPIRFTFDSQPSSASEYKKDDVTTMTTLA